MIVFFFTVNFHRIKFLAIAVGHAIEVYAWAPKPYHKFMAFKVSSSFKVHKIPDIKRKGFLLSVLRDKRQLYFTSVFFFFFHYFTVVQKPNAETTDGEHGHTN